MYTYLIKSITCINNVLSLLRLRFLMFMNIDYQLVSIRLIFCLLNYFVMLYSSQLKILISF